MKLFSGFLLVLAFLTISACTGEDTIVEKTIEKTQCRDGSVVTGDMECPPVTQDQSPTNQNQNQNQNLKRILMKTSSQIQTT